MFYNWNKLNESFFDDIEKDLESDYTNSIKDLYIDDLFDCDTPMKFYDYIIRNTLFNKLYNLLRNAIEKNNFNVKGIDTNSIFNEFLNIYQSKSYKLKNRKVWNYSIDCFYTNIDNNDNNYNMYVLVILFEGNNEIKIDISMVDLDINVSLTLNLNKPINFTLILDEIHQNLFKDCSGYCFLYLQDDIKDFKNGKLNESFFDDIENDLDDGYENDVLNIIDSKLFDQLKIYWKLLCENNNSHIYNNYELVYDYNILSLKSKKNEKKWGNSLSFIEVNKHQYQLLLEILDTMNKMGISKTSNITFNCNGALWRKNASEDIIEIDFKNIEFNGITICEIKPKNLKCTGKITDTRHGAGIYIRECDLSYADTLDFGNINNITIENSINIKDFSFLSNSNIYNYFSFKTCCQETMPECRNYTGLPNKGSYRVIVDFESNNSKSSLQRILTIDNTFNGLNTFVGIPDTVSLLTITASKAPYKVIPYISFEGIDKKLMTKTTFMFHGFGGHESNLVLLVGPNILEPKVRTFKFTKPLLKYMVDTLDYFMDCYKKNEGPHKTYNPDESLVQSKEFISLLKKAAANDLKKQDQKEDFQKMITRALKVLNTDIIYATDLTDLQLGHKMKITKILSDNRGLMLLGRWRNIPISWNQFFTKIKEYPYADPNTKKTLYSQIVEPVIKQRKKLNQLKKELEKLDKQKAKEELSLAKKSELVIDKVKEKVTKIQLDAKLKLRLEITIDYDYSDKAIGIFGKTYNIKDKLKELGAKFNPKLKLPDGSGERGPGWILSKSKKDQLDDIFK